MQWWDEDKFAFQEMGLHKNFSYIHSDDTKNKINRPYVDISLQQSQIGLLGS
jgi:hypothetical protein